MTSSSQSGNRATDQQPHTPDQDGRDTEGRPPDWVKGRLRERRSDARLDAIDELVWLGCTVAIYGAGTRLMPMCVIYGGIFEDGALTVPLDQLPASAKAAIDALDALPEDYDDDPPFPTD